MFMIIQLAWSGKMKLESGKSQGILKASMSGNPAIASIYPTPLWNLRPCTHCIQFTYWILAYRSRTGNFASGYVHTTNDRAEIELNWHKPFAWVWFKNGFDPITLKARWPPWKPNSYTVCGWLLLQVFN